MVHTKSSKKHLKIVNRNYLHNKKIFNKIRIYIKKYYFSINNFKKLSINHNTHDILKHYNIVINFFDKLQNYSIFFRNKHTFISDFLFFKLLKKYNFINE